jgi:hypothetical protein
MMKWTAVEPSVELFVRKAFPLLAVPHTVTADILKRQRSAAAAGFSFFR